MSAEAILAESYRHLSRGDPDGAERILLPIFADAGARFPRALMLMGLIRHRQKRLPEAEMLLVSAADAAPNDVEVQFNLGNLRLGAEQFDGAIESLERAVQLSPAFKPARLALAKALDRAGRHAEAEWALAPLLPAAAGDEVERLMARILINQGRYRDARAYVATRLERQRRDPEARFEHAFLFAKERRYHEALAEYASLERDGVESDVLCAAKAAALLGLRQVDAASDVYRLGVARFPTSTRLHTDWADARRLSGEDGEAANEAFERAVASAPQDMGLRIACAQSLLRGRRVDRAAEVVRAGIDDRTRNHPAPHWMLGVCAVARGDLEAAVGAYRRAAAIAPNKEILKGLAHTLLRLGDAEEALRIIDSGVTKAPTDQEWIAYRCLALRISDDPSVRDLECVDQFVHVIDLPEPSQGWDRLVRALERVHASHDGAFDQVDQIAIQTPRPLMNEVDEELSGFFDMALEATRAFVDLLPASASHPFLCRKRNACRLAGAWTVRLIGGGSHSNHVHTLGWISSAFYAKVPPREVGDHQHAGWLTFGEPDVDMPGCKPLRFVEAKVGRLVLFPSYMWHGTIPFPRGERMTIAFDMLPFGD